MILRDYQKRAIEIANRDEPEIILEATMGSGKSYMISEITKNHHKDMPVVVLTNISILIDQLDKHLKISGIDAHIIKANKHRIGEDNVYLIMEQSFHIDKREEYKNLKNCLLVRDEIHIGYNGKRYKDIINFLEPIKRIGLSGTPYNEDGTFLGQTIPYTILSSPEAIQEGYLTPIRWFVPKLVKNIDLSQAKMSGNDYSTTSLAEIYSTPEFNNAFLKFFNQIEPEERHILVFCSNIDSAEQIGKLLSNYNVAVIHSKNNKKEDDLKIEEFNKGNINIIVSVSRLSIGFDSPIADTIINLRPTKILRLWNQLSFRASRLYEEKKYAEVYDLGRCIEEFGLVDSYHFIPKDTKNEYKKSLKENKLESFDEIIEFKDEDLLEISNDKIKVYIEEIENHKREALTGSLQDIIKAFDISSDIQEVLLYGSMIYEHIYDIKLYDKTKNWILDRWYYLIAEIPQKEKYFKKVFKIRIKNIIKGKKKLASLYYFADFIEQQLRDNEPWLFENQQRDDNYEVIEESDIPF